MEAALAPPGPSRASSSKDYHRVPSLPLAWRRAGVFAFTTPQNKQTPKNTKAVRCPGSKATQTQCHSGIK